MMCNVKVYPALITFILCSIIFVRFSAAGECGEIENAYGPFDYTNPMHYKDKLPIVELRHFTRKVESLVAGERGYVWSDLDYTLRAFPNHHRALNAMSQYQRLNKRPFGAKYYSIECYFDRAIRFKPDDAVVRMLFGIYFHKKKKYDDALKYYESALAINPESAEVHYNMGLLFFQIKKFSKSLTHAKKAYSLGYNLEGLKIMLKEKNIWESNK